VNQPVGAATTNGGKVDLGGVLDEREVGAQSLWAMRRPPATEPASTSYRRGDATGRRSFAVGVATSLGNPKAGVFAVSLIPQFVTAHGPVLASSIALGAIWAVVSGTWFCLRLDRRQGRRASEQADRSTLHAGSDRLDHARPRHRGGSRYLTTGVQRSSHRSAVDSGGSTGSVGS
jgi:hypothetical protein